MVGVDCMRLDRPYNELLELDEVLMDQVSTASEDGERVKGCSSNRQRFMWFS